MARINKIVLEGINYEIVDSTSRESISKLEERTLNQQNTLNVLIGEGEGSIKKQINDSIAEVIDQAPDAFDTLRELADWIEDDKSGAANMSAAITENRQAIEEIKQKTVYLSESEYNNLLNQGLIDPEVEYNIYEDE